VGEWLSGWGDEITAAAPVFLGGLWTTVQLLAISSVVGLVLSMPLALARLSRSRLIAFPAAAYSNFFRGTPLLVQIYLIYYGFAQFAFVRQSVLWSVLRYAYPCALIAFSLNMTAYVSEVVRGGIRAVPRGEIEAATALGMSPWTRTRRIVLPRAYGLMLPALSNEVVIQLKSTSLASTITLLDVTGVGRRLAAASYSTDPLLMAGAIYVVLTFLIARVFRGLEFVLNRHLRINRT
jgi:His/Glu/Gln/Arg/opine family amino acid ABC transporter permease subunit